MRNINNRANFDTDKGDNVNKYDYNGPQPYDYGPAKCPRDRDR